MGFHREPILLLSPEGLDQGCDPSDSAAFGSLRYASLPDDGGPRTLYQHCNRGLWKGTQV